MSDRWQCRDSPPPQANLNATIVKRIRLHHTRRVSTFTYLVLSEPIGRRLRSAVSRLALGAALLQILYSPSTARADTPPPRLEAYGDAPLAHRQPLFTPRTVVSTPFGTSYQVNVNPSGQNIAGDAANEPSLCIDPIAPDRMAIGWRQFDSTNGNFRQAGWAYSTNGGVNWKFGGVLETNVFRSDPVLATDADGNFYYLSLQTNGSYQCDLWRSTNGGANWRRLGPAVGGDKAWMTIDTTAGPGRGNIYQTWSIVANTYSNRNFSLSPDGGLTWTNPFSIPASPFWSTLDTGPDGQLYLLGWNGGGFWLNRSTSATNRAAPFNFDLTVPVDLGGELLYGLGFGPNPEGLLGQPAIAVDRSTNETRGNVYALCTIGTLENLCDVMFARSTDGGTNWSAPVRINTEPAFTNAWHWFGTLSVAPNGRIDVCWYDTRNNPDNTLSELYYCYSLDGGLSWAPNRAISPPFNHSLGYPMQNKIGDYFGMISLNDAACVAYSATFNGEQDIYFVRVEQPFAAIAISDSAVRLDWNAIIGKTYCVQSKTSLTAPWPVGTNQLCVVATNVVMTVTDPISLDAQRFYRVLKQP